MLGQGLKLSVRTELEFLFEPGSFPKTEFFKLPNSKP
jgi:hypothetical protein